MAFVTPVVEHWLEREIAQWVHSMKDRSDDPSHHERTPLRLERVQYIFHIHLCMHTLRHITKPVQLVHYEIYIYMCLKAKSKHADPHTLPWQRTLGRKPFSEIKYMHACLLHASVITKVRTSGTLTALVCPSLKTASHQLGSW